MFMHIPFITAIMLILYTSTWAGEAEEAAQIRTLLYKEVDSWFKGDPDQIISCYAPSFVGYAANGTEAWEVSVGSLDSLKQLVSASVQFAASFAKHPNWSHSREVLHVHIKGDHAVALLHQEAVIPDTTARETTNNTWEDVFMLAKVKGEWKITSAIWRTSVDQKVWRGLPE